MKALLRRVCLAFPAAGLIFLTSCRIEQSMTLRDDLSGTLSASGEAMDFAALAFDDLAILGGFDSAAGLYDDALAGTEAEMKKRGDISRFRVARTSAHGWSAEADFTSLPVLLGSTEAGGIVDYTTSGGVSTLSLLFDRHSSEQYSRLIPLFENPAFSLFDPGQTGELDEETYIRDILGFSFGQENIPQIRRAMVSLRLRLPGSVTSVTGGQKIADDTVYFEMPLTRMLVPDTPVTWAVSWR